MQKPKYQFDSKIFDDFHFLPRASAITFADYANEFIPFLIKQLENTNTISRIVILIAASRI